MRGKRLQRADPGFIFLQLAFRGGIRLLPRIGAIIFVMDCTCWEGKLLRWRRPRCVPILDKRKLPSYVGYSELSVHELRFLSRLQWVQQHLCEHVCMRVGLMEEFGGFRPFSPCGLRGNMVALLLLGGTWSNSKLPGLKPPLKMRMPGQPGHFHGEVTSGLQHNLSVWA